MEMRDWANLKEVLCKELETMTKRPDRIKPEMDTIHKLTDTIKNIDKILKLEGEAAEEGYSRNGGEWESYGRYDRGGGYGGNSYGSRRGMHYVGGHYSRGGDPYGQGMSRGGYSRGGDMERLAEQLRDVMQDGSLSPSARNALNNVINEMQM